LYNRVPLPDIFLLATNRSLNSPERFDTVLCKLPELGVKPRKGTALSLQLSANGREYSSKLPTSELLFHDASISDMNPKRGAMHGGQNVQIIGRGFQKVQQSYVKFTARNNAKKIVDVRYVGEGILEFTAPRIFLGNPNPVSERMTMNLFIGANTNAPIALPDFVYDTRAPSLVSVEIDSGNLFSPFVAVYNSTITIRVTADEPISKITPNLFFIGKTAKLPVISPVNDPATTWAISYVVQTGDEGRLSFELVIENEFRNSLLVNDESSIVEKDVVVDTTPPAITYVQFQSSNPQRPQEATPGETATLIVKFDSPIYLLTMESFSITPEGYSPAVPETSFETLSANGALLIETIGTYPSDSWKISCKIPAQVTWACPVRFSLKAVNVVGNILESFTEASVNPSVSVKALPPQPKS
jgi:hypothetical protein